MLATFSSQNYMAIFCATFKHQHNFSQRLANVVPGLVCNLFRIRLEVCNGSLLDEQAPTGLVFVDVNHSQAGFCYDCPGSILLKEEFFVQQNRHRPC